MASQPALSQIHHRAQTGFTSAQAYDTHRPSYPPEPFSAFLSAIQLTGKPGARIVDLGAGTGKFTAQLAEREEGYEILAVEPHDEMRKVLEGKAMRGVRAVKGTGEDMKDVEGGWADAVVVAQAFHWFASTTALQEIHRVLAPNGHLGLIWNFEDHTTSPTSPPPLWAQRLHALSQRHEDWERDRRHQEWPLLFQEPSIQSLFTTPIQQGEVKWEVKLTKEQIWNHMSTISHIASLDTEGREEARREAMEAMSGSSWEGDCDGRGRVGARMRTVWFWTGKVGEEKDVERLGGETA